MGHLPNKKAKLDLADAEEDGYHYLAELSNVLLDTSKQDSSCVGLPFDRVEQGHGQVQGGNDSYHEMINVADGKTIEIPLPVDFYQAIVRGSIHFVAKVMVTNSNQNGDWATAPANNPPGGVVLPPPAGFGPGSIINRQGVRIPKFFLHTLFTHVEVRIHDNEPITARTIQYRQKNNNIGCHAASVAYFAKPAHSRGNKLYCNDTLSPNVAMEQAPIFYIPNNVTEVYLEEHLVEPSNIVVNTIFMDVPEDKYANVSIYPPGANLRLYITVKEGINAKFLLANNWPIAGDETKLVLTDFRVEYRKVSVTGAWQQDYYNHAPMMETEALQVSKQLGNGEPFHKMLLMDYGLQSFNIVAGTLQSVLDITTSAEDRIPKAFIMFPTVQGWGNLIGWGNGNDFADIGTFDNVQMVQCKLNGSTDTKFMGIYDDYKLDMSNRTDIGWLYDAATGSVFRSMAIESGCASPFEYDVTGGYRMETRRDRPGYNSIMIRMEQTRGINKFAGAPTGKGMLQALIQYRAPTVAGFQWNVLILDESDVVFDCDPTSNPKNWSLNQAASHHSLMVLSKSQAAIAISAK